VLREHGLIPEDLLDPANGARFRPLYTRYLLRAEDHLAIGWQYTLSLPYRQMRLRLACAWPLLIGLRTLALLRVGNVLDPEHRIKVSRPQVRSIMLRSTLLYPVAGLWGGMFDRARRHAAP
jgi:farnesyl-diphosphate farnesyltransferase